MKKTTCIQLVLITAALAGCDRPLYQQGPDYSGTYEGGEGMYQGGDQPDSSNSCPMVLSQLPPDYYIWYSGLQPWDFYYGDGFNLDGYYAYRYPAIIVRAGFGKSAHARVGGTGHS
ncbi:MAG TPA: hypothetical protein VL978_07315 [Puia sp.]|nr:hypothetical protein [Puia sp.]